MMEPEYDPRLGDLTGPDFTGMTEEDTIRYWKNSTLEQRLHEAERLRRIKWGIKALGRMDKTRIEVVNMSSYRNK